MRNDSNNRILTLLGEQEDRRLVEPKNLFTFDDLYDKVWDIENNSRDYQSVIKNLKVIPDQQYGIKLHDLMQDFDLSFSSYGLQRLCAILDIPSSYIRKCLESQKFDLAAYNLNQWLDTLPNNEKTLLLRTTYNRLYGLLSDRYTIFNNDILLDTIHPYVNEDQYLIKNYFVAPEIFKARFVSKEKININGDELSYGIDIKNSRVGLSSIEVTLILYRWICSNGLVIGGGQGIWYTKRHVSVTQEIIEQELTVLINKIPEVVQYIKENVEKSMNEQLNSETIQKYIDKFKAENFVTTKMVTQLTENLANVESCTKWDFVNYITSLAKEYSYDIREKLEEWAGNLLAA